MSELEIVTLILSLILGLSMAQILGTVAHSIRTRRESRLHWVPFAWAAVILLYHVQFWFAIVAVDRIIDAWSWGWFGPVLLMTILLFLSGALLLPGPASGSPKDLIGDFEDNGRLALVPLGLYGLAWVPLNVRLGDGWLNIMNGFNVAVVGLAAVVYFSRDSRVRGTGTLVYLAVSFWAVVWVFSPGAAS